MNKGKFEESFKQKGRTDFSQLWPTALSSASGTSKLLSRTNKEDRAHLLCSSYDEEQGERTLELDFSRGLVCMNKSNKGNTSTALVKPGAQYLVQQQCSSDNRILFHCPQHFYLPNAITSGNLYA